MRQQRKRKPGGWAAATAGTGRARATSSGGETVPGVSDRLFGPAPDSRRVETGPRRRSARPSQLRWGGGYAAVGRSRYALTTPLS